MSRAASRARVAVAVAQARGYQMARRLAIAAITGVRDHLPIAPLADLYPEAPRRPVFEPEVLAIPHPPGMRLHEDWHHVPRSQVSTPGGFVADLRDVAFDPVRNVVLARDRSAVARESIGYTNPRKPRRWPPDRGYADHLPLVEVPGTSTTFRCFLHHRNHYHALIDGLPRLHGVMHDPALADTEVKVLVEGELMEAEAWFLANLLPPNMVPHQVPVDARLQLERLVFPSFVTVPEVGVLPRPYLDWFVQQVVPPRPPKRDRRLHIHRADAAARRVRNGAELSAVLEGHGFEDVSLTGLTLAEQAELFYDAELIVAPHGAALANLVFGTGTGVVEIFNSPFVRAHYYYLAASVGHEWRAVLGDGLGKNDDFAVDVAQVEQAVRDLERVLGI